MLPVAMKYTCLLFVFSLASCVTGTKDWDMQDSNDSSMIADDVMNPRSYSSDSLGAERRGLEDREQRGLTGDAEAEFQLDGEVSASVGTSF
jgi:hypothetical protein